jgi:anthranilate synthase component 1
MAPILPKLDTFKSHYAKGQTQLLYRWMPADLLTPVLAYLKLCGSKPYSFLLESVEGGAVLGRYSIIGFNPDLIWSCAQGQVKIWHDYGSWEMENIPPLLSLKAHIETCKIDAIPQDVPPMAVSGLFGYMGYDMIRLVETVPETNPDALGIDDSIFMRPRTLVIFDNAKNMVCVVAPVYVHSQNSKQTAEECYLEYSEFLENTCAVLNSTASATPNSPQSLLATPLPVESNTSEEEYKSMVRRAVEYIRAGEIFQVVPSQRFSVPFDLPSFTLYRSLRRVNPSPFLFHFQFEDFSLIGSSPEILVRVRDETITIRPIAGTRKRGINAAQDQELAQDLLSDPKERSEHLMLLDLGRNDVGRVAEIGSVKVTDQFIVEYYSHVMHIVSNVEGKLRPDLNNLDALFAGFPAGTVSGAPKIRAMQIIEELEKARRSFYGGGVGYLSANGTMDTCIALRTALLKNGTLYVQSGAGIVADSDPDSEYQETCNKAMALIRAAELAIEEHRAPQSQITPEILHSKSN